MGRVRWSGPGVTFDGVLSMQADRSAPVASTAPGMGRATPPRRVTPGTLKQNILGVGGVDPRRPTRQTLWIPVDRVWLGRRLR